MRTSGLVPLLCLELIEMRKLVGDVRTFYAQLPTLQQHYIPNFRS
jgi:hypothetical protein